LFSKEIDMLGSLSLSGVQVMMHPASVVGQALFYDQPWLSNPRTTSSFICIRENGLLQILIPHAIVTYTPYEILVSNSGMDYQSFLKILYH
jgi:hypothetical protein